MFAFLLVLLILDAILLSIVVLLQAGQGGGLASLGGGTTAQVLGGRGATTLLTKATWWTGGIFMGLSLLLSVVHTRTGAAASDVQKALQQQAQPQAPLPTVPLQGGATPPAAPTGGADSSTGTTP